MPEEGRKHTQATNFTNALESSNASAGSSHEVPLSSDFDFLRRCLGPRPKRRLSQSSFPAEAIPRLEIVNGCPHETIWIAHLAAAGFPRAKSKRMRMRFQRRLRVTEAGPGLRAQGLRFPGLELL